MNSYFKWSNYSVVPISYEVADINSECRAVISKQEGSERKWEKTWFLLRQQKSKIRCAWRQKRLVERLPLILSLRPPFFVYLPLFSIIRAKPKSWFRLWVDPDFGIGKAGNSITKSESSSCPRSKQNTKHTILAVRDYHCAWNWIRRNPFRKALYSNSKRL